MKRHDEANTFVCVGRIEVGTARVACGSLADAAGVHVSIPIKMPRGAIEHYGGSGPDVASAVTEGLKSLSRVAFAIDNWTRSSFPLAADATGQGQDAGTCGAVPVSVGVLVRSLDAAEPDADAKARYAVGHAVARDEATAIAHATVRALAVGGLLQRRFLSPGAHDVEASTDRIVEGIGGLLADKSLSPEAVGGIRELVAYELNRFGAAQAIVATNSPDPEIMLTRFDAQAALVQAEGATKTSDTQTSHWWEWFPELDNDHRTLREVLSELPAAPAAAIPWIVRLFENPQGWLRLHGAVSLRNHDMIHVLLGRGLLDQDEAFVIGFTMGSTKAVSSLERWLFKSVVSNLYPEPYRISRKTLAAYDLGLQAGEECGVKNLHLVLRDDMLDRPLGETRRKLQIDTDHLRRFYARERAALPGTLASLRLPVEHPREPRATPPQATQERLYGPSSQHVAGIGSHTATAIGKAGTNRPS